MNQRESERDVESLREPQRATEILSGSLWLSLTLSGSLWLSLAHSGSLWLTLAPSGSRWLSLAFSGSLWLSQALSGSLRLSFPLRICLQSPCLAHKVLARLVASLLRYSTLFSPGPQAVAPGQLPLQSLSRLRHKISTQPDQHFSYIQNSGLAGE